MRVAVVTEQLLAPVPGGIGRYTRELSAALARCAGRADAVSTWTAWHRDPTAAAVPGVAGPRRLPLPRRALAAVWEHGVGPAPRGADLVHAPSLLVPPARRGCARVVTVHDAVPWTHPETLTPRGARWHRAMAERVVRGDATIAVVTEVVALELREVLPGLAADRIRVLGAGVSEEFRAGPSPGQVAEVRSRLVLPERFILTLATLEPRKGLDVLIAALARLGAGAPPLLVAGQPGWGSVDLDATARAAGLPSGAVRGLGRIEDRELSVVLRAAELLVAPSLAEGFGLPVAEAMAVGTCVLCSDAPALVEVAGDAAVIVARGDAAALAEAIEATLADGALRDRLSAVGLLRSKRYTWDSVAQRAWDLYRELGGVDGR
ncbi:MAG: glycosyltransferase family 4 protein [Actinomycetota bacterium]|nr:glycosyltransferase family 4 protein [Actinomycetota bacterium]